MIPLPSQPQQILAHTEDALAATLNHFYIVSAHIINDSPEGKYKVLCWIVYFIIIYAIFTFSIWISQVTEERFTSLCYAGHLPGYTMNYNHHGLVFSINTLSAKRLQSGKTRKIKTAFLYIKIG